MADRICGQPSNLTVASAGTGGNVRMTYQPWELDWEWFNTITVGVDWLANTTTAVSAQITAKGGAENLGYWFEVGVAFPSVNWNTGDRMTPQRQAAINQYATFAAAVAAMAVHDMLLVWYQNTANRRFWLTGCDMNGIAGSVWGMLSRGQIIVSTCKARGNLLAQNQQILFVNLSAGGGLTPDFGYNPTAAQAGAGLIAKRCNTCGFGAALGFSASNHAAGTVIWENCRTHGNGQCFASGVARNCTVFYGDRGFLNCEANLRNLVAFECQTTCFSGGAVAGAQHCADTDGTLPVHATNLRNQNMRTQLKFFYDLARPGNKAFPTDPRIYYDSVLRAAGVNVGVVVDGDGQVRPDPPAIGAYEPYSTCYAPAGEMVKKVRIRQVGA